MNIICLDFETCFDSDYTLKKLSTEAYVRDPRFEVMGAALRWQRKTQWFTEEELRWLPNQISWRDTAILCHHAQFDGLILSQHFKIKPKFWFDTLSMARLMIGNHLPLGLDALAKHFDLTAKNVPYNMFKGKHWIDLSPIEQQELANGCIHDVELTWEIFRRLSVNFPEEEYTVIDQTIRMFTEPRLRADTKLLGDVWSAEETKKAKMLVDLGIDEAACQSATQFAELLRNEGVELSEATKAGKNGPIPAFAKTDEFMRRLLEHENEKVQALARARLSVKSTLLQSRAETLGWMASRGSLCVYLHYCGAHTLRWSGGDGSNFQNFKRGSDIRNAILAPEGYKLAVIDLSQIECRILNFLAGQEDVTERFRRGEDPYVGIASEFYGRTITRSDPFERGAGKQAELMCGYGAGADKFMRTAKAGLYGPPITLSIEDATRFVKLYRQTHDAVCGAPNGYWQQADRMLVQLANGSTIEWGPITIADHRIWMPNGACLIYDTLKWYMTNQEDNDFTGWRLKTRQGWTKMYGAKLVQNVCEALARLVLSQAMLRIREAGLVVATCSHDEAVVLIPEGENEWPLFNWCIQEMKKEPAWLKGCPIECEGVMGERYEK